MEMELEFYFPAGLQGFSLVWKLQTASKSCNFALNSYGKIGLVGQAAICSIPNKRKAPWAPLEMEFHFHFQILQHIPIRPLIAWPKTSDIITKRSAVCELIDRIACLEHKQKG